MIKSYVTQVWAIIFDATQINKAMPRPPIKSDEDTTEVLNGVIYGIRKIINTHHPLE